MKYPLMDRSGNAAWSPFYVGLLIAYCKFVLWSQLSSWDQPALEIMNSLSLLIKISLLREKGMI